MTFGIKVLGCGIAIASLGVGTAHAGMATLTTFASFQQENSGAEPWIFINSGPASTFNASGVAVNFQASQPPASILDFTDLFNGTFGSVIASLTAMVDGPAIVAANGIRQNLLAGAELTFVNALDPSDTVLDIVFTGAITGLNSSVGGLGSSTLAGQAIVYSSDHLAGGASFQQPFLFSMSIDATLTVNANGFLDNFVTSSTGSFRTSGAGAIAPEPSSLAVMGLGAGFLMRRRRTK